MLPAHDGASWQGVAENQGAGFLESRVLKISGRFGSNNIMQNVLKRLKSYQNTKTTGK